MNNFLFFLCFCTIFIFSNCTNHQTINICQKDDHKQTDFSQWFSSIEMENLSKCSNEKIDMMYKKGDTLEIGSGGKLIYMPFDIDSLSVDLIKNKIGNLFVEIDRIEVDHTGLKREIVLLKYRNSFIKLIILKNSDFSSNAMETAECHYTQPEKVKIVSANINDPEIIMRYGIKIGMPKMDYFNKIFPTCDIDILKDINVVLNEDTQGEYLQQKFIFKNNKLVNIIMQMPDSFISTDL